MKPLLHPASDEARQRIGAAASGKRYDDLHGPIGIVLGRRKICAENNTRGQRSSGQSEATAQVPLHVMAGLVPAILSTKARQCP
jgi:hypothetical protein